MCVVFFVVSIPVTRALQEVVYFIFHTSVSHVSLHVIVISFCFGNFLFFFWYFVVCLFGLLLTAYSLTSVKLLHEAIISQEN